MASERKHAQHGCGILSDAIQFTQHNTLQFHPHRSKWWLFVQLALLDDLCIGQHVVQQVEGNSKKLNKMEGFYRKECKARIYQQKERRDQFWQGHFPLGGRAGHLILQITSFSLVVAVGGVAGNHMYTAHGNHLWICMAGFVKHLGQPSKHRPLQ